MYRPVRAAPTLGATEQLEGENPVPIILLRAKVFARESFARRG